MVWHTCSIFGFFDSIFVSFCSFIIFYILRRQWVISAFFVSFISIDWGTTSPSVRNYSCLTTEYALLLEAALGTNASIWIGLQTDYNIQKAKQDKPFMKRLEKIRKIAAVFWAVWGDYRSYTSPQTFTHHSSHATKSRGREIFFASPRAPSI